MSNSRRRTLNPGNILLVLGIALLVVSFQQPAWSAARTARVEGHADTITEWLLEAAVEAAPKDLQGDGVRLGLARAVVARCLAADVAADHFLDDYDATIQGIPTADILARPPLKRLSFQGKHYMYVVQRAEPEARMSQIRGEDDYRPPWEQLTDPDTTDLEVELPPIEVYAWPVNRRVGPAHTAFFAAEDGLRAYTRNLQKAYNGTSRTPQVGCARRRGEEANPASSWYRGTDDERWRDRVAAAQEQATTESDPPADGAAEGNDTPQAGNRQGR